MSQVMNPSPADVPWRKNRMRLPKNPTYRLPTSDLFTGATFSLTKRRLQTMGSKTVRYLGFQPGTREADTAAVLTRPHNSSSARGSSGCRTDHPCCARADRACFTCCTRRHGRDGPIPGARWNGRFGRSWGHGWHGRHAGRHAGRHGWHAAADAAADDAGSLLSVRFAPYRSATSLSQ